MRDYFAAAPAPDEDKVRSLDDLAPVIELYHHTVRAGRYDEACKLFHDRLNELTYYHFGAYQLRIELLRALFADGEERPPRLKDQRAQSLALTAHANSYSLSCHLRRAVAVQEVANAMAEGCPDWENLAVGLTNLGMRYHALGELRAAEAGLSREVEVSREIANQLQEAVGHQELGRLLSYRGVFDEAEGELELPPPRFPSPNPQLPTPPRPRPGPSRRD